MYKFLLQILKTNRIKERAMKQASSVQSKAITLGFWSALLTAIFVTLFVISTFVFLSPDWKGIESYSKSFNSLQLVPVIPPVLFAVTIIVLMVRLHYYVAMIKGSLVCSASLLPSSMRPSFVSMPICSFFVVRLNIMEGELESLAILAMPNLHSAFFALEASGYSFLSAAVLAISPVFKGGRLASWIRGLFLAIGVVGIYGAVIAILDIPVLILAGLGIWNLLFPISMVLVCIFFKNADQQTRSSSNPAQQQLAH
jgi:hypothetical protein